MANYKINIAYANKGKYWLFRRNFFYRNLITGNSFFKLKELPNRNRETLEHLNFTISQCVHHLSPNNALAPALISPSAEWALC